MNYSKEQEEKAQPNLSSEKLQRIFYKNPQMTPTSVRSRTLSLSTSSLGIPQEVNKMNSVSLSLI